VIAGYGGAVTDPGESRGYTARGPATGESWPAVAAALNARMAERRTGQKALSEASGVSVATLRQLQRGTSTRRVQNATLQAIARALDWPDDHLIDVLLSRPTDKPATPPGWFDYAPWIDDRLDALERRLDTVDEHLTALRDSFDSLSRRLDQLTPARHARSAGPSPDTTTAPDPEG